MPRKRSDGNCQTRDVCSAKPHAAGANDAQLASYWKHLSLARRRALMRIPRRELFEAIRTRYCSRCYGLFALRYEELRCSNMTEGGDGCAACQACPACQDFFLGMTADPKAVTLEDRLLEGEPFEMFRQSKARQRERDLQFSTAGDVCGSGFCSRRNGKVCALHTTRVSSETLLAYWQQLPAEHQHALFSLPRHDFEAELDSCCSLQLRICRDCRYNVLAQYKLALAAGRRAAGRTSTSGKDSTAASDALALQMQPPPLLPVCDGFQLSVTDASVQLVGTDASALLEEAEEIEDLKGGDGQGGEDGTTVRHAETPELAQEALLDAIILIFKAQVEVAFREQTAGHNALLLLVALGHEMLEKRLQDACLDVHARRAEEELLELVAEDEKRQTQRASRNRRRKKAAAAIQQPAEAALAEQNGAPTGEPRPSANSPAHEADEQQQLTAKASSPPIASSATPIAAEVPAAALETAASDDAAYSIPSSDLSHATWHDSSGHQSEEDEGQWEVKQRSRRSMSRRTTPPPPTQRHQHRLASPPVASAAAAGGVPHSVVASTLQPQQQQIALQSDWVGAKHWANVVSGAVVTTLHAQELPASQHAPPAAMPRASIPQQHQPQPAAQSDLHLRKATKQAPQQWAGRAVTRPQPPSALQQAATAAVAQLSLDAGVSRRSSAEYSLWGDDGSSSAVGSSISAPLRLSSSRESLAAVSEMSIGSPPGASSDGRMHGGLSAGAAEPSKPTAGFVPLQPVSDAASNRMWQQSPTTAATSAEAGGGFSLFCHFPAVPSQQVPASAGSSLWSGAMPARFSLFGTGGIAGPISQIPTVSF